MFRACLFTLASVLGFVAPACNDDACHLIEDSDEDSLKLAICFSADVRAGADQSALPPGNIFSALSGSGFTDCDVASCEDVDFCGNADITALCLGIQAAVIAAGEGIQVACEDDTQCPASAHCGRYKYCLSN